MGAKCNSFYVTVGGKKTSEIHSPDLLPNVQTINLVQTLPEDTRFHDYLNNVPNYEIAATKTVDELLAGTMGKEHSINLPPMEINKSAIYIGEWKNGKRHGKGLLKWYDGGEYEGEWFDGKAHGKGKFIHKEGDSYEGNFTSNQTNGYGVYKRIDNLKYEGFWKGDQQHGKGKEEWPDGSKYEGEYVKKRFMF